MSAVLKVLPEHEAAASVVVQPRAARVVNGGHGAEEAAAPAGPTEAMLGMLLDETPQGILVINAQGVVAYANLAMSVLFPMRSVRQNARLAEQAGMEDIAALVAGARGGQKRVMAEVRVAFKSGKSTLEERVYQAVAAPMPEVSGGVWVMVEDVTGHALTEQIRKDFVTNASHELRTPLSLIHGYIETLKSGMIKGGASLNRCLEVMEKHSKRMMRIIEDMLTISRLEGGDAQLRTEKFNVRGCVEDVLEHLTPLIEARQPVITLKFPEQGGILDADRFYWDQIFTNLIENSLKENPRTGLRIDISGQWTEDECVLMVADDGVGIPAEDVPFVFKRFFRCAKHHSQEIKGTGLGLSIVKRAVEAHGGTIELRSEPGVQTAFIMRVPV